VGVAQIEVISSRLAAYKNGKPFNQFVAKVDRKKQSFAMI
jgi:hypothetical protein